ncbi:unnamed protein product, partial [Diatraea saccharalis]
DKAWVTLATNDSYGLGALVLAHSLRRAGSIYPAAVLITPSVTEAMRERLRAVFAEVVSVDVLDSRDAAHLALLQRPELGITFTKIHCWGLTQYEKCVFLDADTLIVQNCDELFEREELSAAPDVGWPDCFNSGVFVYKPSQETLEQLIKFAQERGSFDGGDQGLLNSFFSDWAQGDSNKRLPFLYNVTSAAFYSYLPALKHYGQNLKIIHFIGATKPWLQQFNWESRSVDAPDHLREFLQIWWDLFVGQVHPQLDVSMVEVPEVPPELPPQDISHHYMPVVDPESEFPWHHPDAQTQEDFQRLEIDLTQYHDPWAIYGGQIPSYKDDAPIQTLSGRVEDHEEMKKYAWEYQPPYQDYRSETFTHPPHSYQHFEHKHQDSSQHHHAEHHRESQSQHSHGHYHDQPFYSHQQHAHEHRQYSQEYQWHSHEHNQHSYEHQQHSHQHHQHSHDHQQYSHEHHQHSHDHQPYSHEHQQHSNDYQQYSHEHQQHLNQHQHEHHQQSQHKQTQEQCQPDSHHSQDYQHDDKQEYFDQGHSQHSHDHHHTHFHQPHDSQDAHQKHDYQDSFISRSVSHSTIPVHHVHINHEVPYHAKGSDDENIDQNENRIMNGDVSENENEYHEDIRPRHPYDNFYLRHRAIIDSYGRKICTHEVPAAPKPSPPSDYECEDPPFSLPEEIPLTNGYCEEQVSFTF